MPNLPSPPTSPFRVCIATGQATPPPWNIPSSTAASRRMQRVFPAGFLFLISVSVVAPTFDDGYATDHSATAPAVSRGRNRWWSSRPGSNLADAAFDFSVLALAFDHAWLFVLVDGDLLPGRVADLHVLSLMPSLPWACRLSDSVPLQHGFASSPIRES